ncbi:MAG: sigma-70 family RNA polymerase sigma factor [Polyangiaceae bacterium]
MLPAFEQLATKFARRWRRSTPEDLLSAGMLRLTEITPDFVPALQEEFMAYAYPYVRGAMLREAFKTVNLHVREKAMLAMDFRDGPADPAGRDLLATMMSTEKAPSAKNELREYMQLRAAGMVLASVAAEKPAPTEDEAIDRLDYQAAISALESAIQDLDARSKKVVDLLYYQGLTLDEAGEALGKERGKPYTKRHVSRMHEEVRLSLAKALRRAGIISAIDDSEDPEE